MSQCKKGKRITLRYNKVIGHALAAPLAAGGLILAQGPATVHAQTIDPYYLLPLPNGTNELETYGTYQHFNAFQFSNGRNVPNTSLDEYTATIRYAHYVYIAGLPAGLQIFQSVDYATNWQVNGVNYNNAPGARKLGASNTTLSAFFWPYANWDNQTFVYTAAYLTPPDGSYSPNNTFNAAYGGWQGDMQFGALKGFNSNLSVEAAFDADFRGRESLDFGGQRSTDPTYRLQVWANWDWNPALRTSLGYTGVFGGAVSDWFMGTQTSLERNAETQTIRADVSYWWTPGIMTSFELSHDIQAGGGYQLGIGAQGRIKFLF